MNFKYFLITPLLFVSTFLASCQSSSNQNASNSESINTTISVDEFEKKLNESKDYLLIDVRTTEEYIGGHLPNSANINFNADDFNEKIQKLDKSKTIMIYCLSGGRSSNAASDMIKMGFNRIYNMKGGILAWRNANKPTVTTTNTIENGMTMDEFTKMVTNDKYVLVDFNAKWCKPCKEMMPMFDKIAVEKIDKLLLKKVDADINKDLLQLKKIESIPYLELYKNGKLIWHHSGKIDEQTFLAETKL
jgi:rhodanese-related sulfurtransferase